LISAIMSRRMLRHWSRRQVRRLRLLILLVVRVEFVWVLRPHGVLMRWSIVMSRHVDQGLRINDNCTVVQAVIRDI
jgi:hypothetical protein